MSEDEEGGTRFDASSLVEDNVKDISEDEIEESVEGSEFAAHTVLVRADFFTTTESDRVCSEVKDLCGLKRLHSLKGDEVVRKVIESIRLEGEGSKRGITV